MTKNKRITILILATFFFILGFLSITIAINYQDIVNRKYVNIIGLSSFGFWGLSLFLLMKNSKNLISSEINEKVEKMHNDANFFSMININENSQTLEERFINSGFKTKFGYLHKRQFSISGNFVNYYVIIVKEVSITEYLHVFLEKAEDLLKNNNIFTKINVVYLFFFNGDITDEDLKFLKKVIVNQDLIQGLPGNSNTILPIVYDIANHKYILKTLQGRFHIKPLRIALKKFYRLIIHTV